MVQIWIVWTLTIYKIYNNILDISFLLWINHFWFQNQFLSFWRFAKNSFPVRRPSNRLRLCWKSGNSRITRKWSSLRMRKSKKIYVPVLTVIGSFHVQSLESFEIESEILESRPKESGKSCHLKISREFKILIQLSTQIFDQMVKNFKKIGRFMKFLIKLYHISVLSMVLDFGRIFEIFETGNSKLGFHVTHFSNKIPSY